MHSSTTRFGFHHIGPTGRAAKEAPQVLQHDLRLGNAIEAGLTDVVLGLRSDFVAGPAKNWASICAVDEMARGELEKRVTTALRQGFFQFSQLLCGLEVLLLQSQQFGVVREQTLLGIEQLFVHRDDHLSELVAVADSHGSLGHVSSGFQRTDGAGDERQIHVSSPGVEKGGVGTPDSTSGGNAQEEADA